jgi:ribonuclease P protein component
VFGRLKRRAEYLQVAAANKKWVAPGLILQVCRHSRSSENVSATHCGGDDILRPPLSGADMPSSSSVPNATLPQASLPMRVGFTASRKVGNAVRRNRARRRLRAAADLVVPRHGAPGHDIVLIARQGTLDRDFTDLVGDLTRGLRKLGAYRTEAGEGTESAPGQSQP